MQLVKRTKNAQKIRSSYSELSATQPPTLARKCHIGKQQAE
jgi:hypothetical protein